MSGINTFTTEQLKEEIKRREEEASRLWTEERKSREIEVECEECYGSGKVQESWGECDCLDCAGKGYVVGHRRKV